MSYLCCGALFLLVSCNKMTRTLEKRTKNGPTIDFGAGLPEIMGTRNDTVSIALFPSAQYFFIDLGLKQSAQNIKLIKNAKRLNIPVRAKIYEDNRHEIAQIYPATPTDIEKYKKAMSNEPAQEVKKP